MITSLNNETVKEVVALRKKANLRKERGLFVVEGRRFVQEIPDKMLERAFATPAFGDSREGAALCRRLRAEYVSEPVLAKMADTVTPQGIVALVRMPFYSLENLSSGPLALLEEVQDPGNIGTLFRTAEAAGAGGLILDGKSADPFSPKVLRATMGAIFRLPFVISPDLSETVRSLKEKGYRVYAAHLKGRSSYDQPDYQAKSAFLLGNEGRGLSDTLTDQADELIRIPMEGQAESLNVSVAGALLLYETRRNKAARNGLNR